MEEIYHSVAQQLDDERKRRVSAVQTLNIAENSNKDLKDRKSTRLNSSHVVTSRMPSSA